MLDFSLPPHPHPRNPHPPWVSYSPCQEQLQPLFRNPLSRNSFLCTSALYLLARLFAWVPLIPLYSVPLWLDFRVSATLLPVIQTHDLHVIWVGVPSSSRKCLPSSHLQVLTLSIATRPTVLCNQILDAWFSSDHWRPSLSLRYPCASFYSITLFLTSGSPHPNLFPCIHSPRLMRSKHYFFSGIWLPFTVYTQIYNKSSTQKETKKALRF